MSKKEKLFKRLCANPAPTDFPWEKLIALMEQNGFTSTRKQNCKTGHKGKGGSHYTFEHASGYRFGISKTHPEGTLKGYQVKAVKRALKHVGVI